MDRLAKRFAAVLFAAVVGSPGAHAGIVAFESNRDGVSVQAGTERAVPLKPNGGTQIRFKPQGCVDNQNCANIGNQPSGSQRKMQNQNGGSDQNDQMMKRRKANRNVNDNQNDSYNQNGGNNQNDQVTRRKKSRQNAQSAWRDDSHKNRRRNHRDNTYRFSYGGFWYDQPYWLEEGYSPDDDYGISCGDGRDIVDQEGFNRVRVVECNGRTFTYVGLRHGDMFQVKLDSITGRILSARPI
jgi:hypothetical protein